MAETHTTTIGSEIRDQVEDVTDKARKRFGDAQKQLKSQAEDAWDDLIEVIRKHPGKALGIALGAGVAVGLAAGSMRKRDSATSQLKGLAGTGADAWDRVKSGLEEAVCNLKDAFGEAAGKFK